MTTESLKRVEGVAFAVPFAARQPQTKWTTFKTRRNPGIKSQHLMMILIATLFAAVFTNGIAVTFASAQEQAKALTEKRVETIALQWFEQMRTGQIDRAQLTAEYNAQLTDDAVKKMSAYLNEYKYGASPTGARILRTRTSGEQTFYDVKLTFPRGDAASLLIGFNAEGKITGIALMSMAGD
jgi:hypothetical protein